MDLSDQDVNNNVIGSLTTHRCPSHIGQVLRLPGAVSLDVLHNASLRITLTVQEVVGNEWEWGSPLLLNPSSITKMHS